MIIFYCFSGYQAWVSSQADVDGIRPQAQIAGDWHEARTFASVSLHHINIIGGRLSKGYERYVVCVTQYLHYQLFQKTYSDYFI